MILIRTPQIWMTLMVSVLCLSSFANNYISQSANGDVIFTVTYDQPQAYVEVFSQQNSQQNIAQNIVGSQVANVDGSFTYSLTRSGAQYSNGDEIVARFYAYEPGQAGVFIPGPTASTWSDTYTIGSVSTQHFICKSATLTNGGYTNHIGVFQDGSVRFRFESDIELDYIEVFAKNNGLQNLALNIVNSGYPVHGGGFYYEHITSANYFNEGDDIDFRFYFYRGNSGQLFVPGPSASTWNDNYDWTNYCDHNEAIFVSTSGYDDNDGSLNSPVSSIQLGIDLAEAQGLNEVRVAHGRYFEHDIVIKDGVSVLGGYSPDFTERDLTHNRYSTAVDAYTIGSYYACYSQRAFGAVDITSPTVLEGFTITGGSHCGYYSPIGGGGLLIIRSNSNFEVRHNRIFENGVFGASPYTRGGNVYMWQSSARILYNEIVYGFSPVSGADLWAYEGLNGEFAEIAYNTFTSVYSTTVDPGHDFHDNNYLNLKKPFDHRPQGNERFDTNETTKRAQVLIYDLKGALVKTVKNSTVLDRTVLNPGLYITVQDVGTTISRKKVFIQ